MTAKVATVAAPKFKHDVTFCLAAMPKGALCHRLPAHKDSHAAYVTGNGVRRPKVAKVAKPKASVKVAAPSDFVAQLDAKLAALRAEALAEFAARQPKASVKQVTRAASAASKAGKPKASAKVYSLSDAMADPTSYTFRQLAAVEADRKVAAPTKVTKVGRGAHASGRPSARLA